MKRSSYLLVAGAAVAAASLWALQPHPTAARAATGTLRRPYDRAMVSQSISFFEVRVRQDPAGAISAARLAGLYLQRYRESGDFADVGRAEKAARRSLAIRERNNSEGFMRLAQSLNAQHRFRDSLAMIKKARTRLCNPAFGRGLACDLMIETGRYDAARKELAAAPPSEREELLPAVARMQFIDGQPDKALAALHMAVTTVDRSFDMGAADAAWYHTKLGQLLASTGRADEAAAELQKALQMFPNDHKAMASLAEIAASRGDWNGVVTWSRRALEWSPSPELHGMLSDAYAALGFKEDAKRELELIHDESHHHDNAIGHGDNTFHRHSSLATADHGIHLDDALELARDEMKVRTDIYSWDTLAWALHANHLNHDAAKAMKKAMALGTRDSRLHYHAGMIALSLGDKRAARAHLAEAARIGGCYPQATTAARTLASL